MLQFVFCLRVWTVGSWFVERLLGPGCRQESRLIENSLRSGVSIASSDGSISQDLRYAYLHQRADLKVSRGIIPVGFYSCIPAFSLSCFGVCWVKPFESLFFVCSLSFVGGEAPLGGRYLPVSASCVFCLRLWGRLAKSAAHEPRTNTCRRL